MEDNKKKLIAFGAIALVAGGVVTATILGNLNSSESNSTSQDSANSTPTTTNTSTPSISITSVVSAIYKNGTYQATGVYTNPQEPAEKIVVSLTLENDIVKDANVTANASNSTTQRYQTEFINNYKSQVIGKKLDDVRLSKVSGSSLTSGGFNDAIGQIKTQAKV